MKIQTNRLTDYQTTRPLSQAVWRLCGQAALILSFVIFHWSLAHAFPGSYLLSLPDKMTTTKEVVMLSGVGKNLVALKVNGRAIKVSPEGKFSCGIVLHRGKNLVMVKAQDKRGKSFLKKVRILKLEDYPDLANHWAQKKIATLATLGFIEGYPDGNFYPEQPITRGEFATWLARVKRLYRSPLMKDPFLDVPKEHWRAAAITAVVKKNYMKEITSKYFGIEEAILRSQAAYIATKAEGIKIVWQIKKLFFQDLPKEVNIAAPIYSAKKKGLVVGVSKIIPLFEPARNLTRAEAAILLSRFNRSQGAIRYLANFNKGFNKDALAKINVSPEIEKFSIEPESIYLNTENIVKIRAKVASRKGFYPIAKVKVDLTSIGGVPDAEMFDDGSSGDEAAGDNIYSLNLKLTISESGERNFRVTAIDTLGWEGEAQAKLWVVK